jgi:hypothetical protein
LSVPVTPYSVPTANRNSAEPRVRGDQQHLEEHEQVEQVARQERAVDAEQLELEQRVVLRTARIVAGSRVHQARHRDHRREQQHRHGEAVGDQDDAERRRPVAERVHEVRAVTDAVEQE